MPHDRETPLVRTIAWLLQRSPVRAYLRYSNEHGSALADSVTYRTLFSVFAGVLLGFSLAALWLAGNPAAWTALTDALDAAIPGLVGEGGLVRLDSIQAPAGLSIAGAVSLLGLIGAAIGAIGSLRVAIRRLAGTSGDDVAFVWVVLRNLGLAVGAGLLLAASAAATVLGTAGLGVVADGLGVAHDHALVAVGARALAVAVTFAMDAVVVAALFRVLSGLRVTPGALWSGAVLAAAGLTVLQQLSGLFVGGAASNPLLATFASLIALLLWLNLSSQVILIACAFIVTRAAERRDRVRERFGVRTFAALRVRQAEDAVDIAVRDLNEARAAQSGDR